MLFRSFTLVYGILDLKDLSFQYTSAGHLGPVLMKKDSHIEQFDGHGPPVGMFADASYGKNRIQLEPGDRLFLLSDGVYEARNSKEQELGLPGIYQYLQSESTHNYSLEYTVNSLARAVYHWSLPGKPGDDISIIGLEIK